MRRASLGDVIGERLWGERSIGLGDPVQGILKIEVPHQHHRRVVRRIIHPIKRLQLLQGSRFKMLHGANGGPAVGVRLKEGTVEQFVDGSPHRVIDGEATLIFNHLQLATKRLLVQNKARNSIGLKINHRGQMISPGDQRLGIKRPVHPGGSVGLRAPAFHLLIELSKGVLSGPLEHQVLKKVRQPRAFGILISAPHSKPRLVSEDRRPTIGHQHHSEAVLQNKASGLKRG